MSVARCHYEVFVQNAEPYEVQDEDLREALSEVIRLSRVERERSADRFRPPRWSAPSREGALARVRNVVPLEGEVASAIEAAPALYSIEVELEDPDDLGYLHAALSIAHEAISERGGVVVDRTSGVAYTAAQLAAILEDGPGVRDMVSVEEERNGDHVRLQTRGMSKWWQQDFVVAGVPNDLAELGRRLLLDTLCDYASSHGTIEADQSLQYDRQDPQAKLFFAAEGESLLVSDCHPEEKKAIAGIDTFIRLALPAYRTHRATEELEAKIAEGDVADAIAHAKKSGDPAMVCRVAILAAQNDADDLESALGAVTDRALSEAPEGVVGDLVSAVAQASDLDTLQALVARLPKKTSLLGALVAASSELDSEESLAVLDWVRAQGEPAEGSDERDAWVQAWVNSCVDARSIDDRARAVTIAEGAQKYGAEDARIHHLSACLFVAAGEPERAVEQVQKAAALDYDMDNVAEDDELEAIRGHEGFQKAISDWQKRREQRSARVASVTDDSFEEVVLGGSLPTLVDFWADWCGPCHAIAPVVAQLAEKYEGRAEFVKVDVDANEALSERFEIQSIPTLILFRDGKIVERVSGAVPKQVLEGMLKKVL
jgi:thioredoxin 1